MKRKKADTASFYRASGKKSAQAQNEDGMEKEQAESEDEELSHQNCIGGKNCTAYVIRIRKFQLCLATDDRVERCLATPDHIER